MTNIKSVVSIDFAGSSAKLLLLCALLHQVLCNKLSMLCRDSLQQKTHLGCLSGPADALGDAGPACELACQRPSV